MASSSSLTVSLPSLPPSLAPLHASMDPPKNFTPPPILFPFPCCRDNRKTTNSTLLDKFINKIRFLAIDAVEKANSGHPGLPMGCTPMGHILYDEVKRYNPKNPKWFNRDRFVLSVGHGCMLQYILLYT
ncbi:unnamed protein product [Fraxinus pennsylvanica]|uniref:Transketolase N-terminal domain-containing protein n=1 Tax=Fraxinus pennsylvanica TaxID=56036 RepID=A0AAD1ZDW2_9LAMI|nr:unnamed protein product [Fraxinus pennsylvanica]